MGRPLSKDVNGLDVRGTYAGANAGVRLDYHDGSTVQTDGIIIKQRGARTFVVASVGTPSTTYVRVLANGTPSAGQMRMYGYVASNSGSTVNIAKITKRVATDFSGNRYTWVLSNDSSNDYIVLTPIA